jgi:enamine deaminase RidA (YjgF/YER057c/UK114 family)
MRDSIKYPPEVAGGMETDEQLTLQGGGRFEQIGSYARLRRVGQFILVAGTTAVEPSGRLHAPGDTYRQTAFILARIAGLLEQAGSGLHDVVRTRAYLSDIGSAAAFARAHGEAFAGILPVCTAVGATLTVPGMMVEIEVDAIAA